MEARAKGKCGDPKAFAGRRKAGSPLPNDGYSADLPMSGIGNRKWVAGKFMSRSRGEGEHWKWEIVTFMNALAASQPDIANSRINYLPFFICVLAFP
jgi:hypothetical protein